MPDFANSPIRLADLCHIQLGYNARGRLEPACESGCLAIQMRDFDVQGNVDARRLGRFDLPSVPERYLVRRGDVLFRSRGDHTTATALDSLDVPVVAIVPLVILRPRTDVLDPRFLVWAINRPASQRHLEAGAQGQSLRMISRPCLESLLLDLPDRRTQAAIVMADALAAEEERLAIRLAALKRQCIAASLARAASHPMEPA